jgi:hypothetical protein
MPAISDRQTVHGRPLLMTQSLRAVAIETVTVRAVWKIGTASDV